jgi:hypothetical protein
MQTTLGLSKTFLAPKLTKTKILNKYKLLKLDAKK